MSEIEIRSSTGAYSIYIDEPLGLTAIDATFILVDSHVPKALIPSSKHIFSIETFENQKRLETVEKIIFAMAEAGVSRGDCLLAIGGGVVQDLATLAASLYMRGISWVFVPTTFTAMVDSCIGGKSSINVGDFKNLIGNFYPPRAVYVETVFLESLPVEHLVSGLAEAVKICFARGFESFSAFRKNPASIKPGSDEQTASLIHLSLEAKKWFIEIDEFDQAERKLLNFGHSFGHAIESSTAFRTPHGVAVAIGMLAAVSIAEQGQAEMTADLHAYCKSLLRPLPDLRAWLEALDVDAFKKALLSDKKNSPGVLRLVVPTSEGLLELRDYPITEGGLVKAVAALRSALDEVTSEVL